MTTPFPDRPASDLAPPAAPPASDQPSAPQTPPGGVPQRQLLRSSTNKVLGGVCGGLAEYTNTDALLWRVGFIALALMGAGIVVYALLWLLVPTTAPGDSGISGIHDTLRNGRVPRT